MPISRYFNENGFFGIIGNENKEETTSDKLTISFLQDNNITNWNFGQPTAFLERLDYIFYKNLRCLDEKIFKYDRTSLVVTKMGTFDHAPIYFTFDFNDNKHISPTITTPWYGYIYDIKNTKSDKSITFRDYNDKTELFNKFITQFGKENIETYLASLLRGVFISVNNNFDPKKYNCQKDNDKFRCNIGDYSFIYTVNKLPF